MFLAGVGSSSDTGCSDAVVSLLALVHYQKQTDRIGYSSVGVGDGVGVGSSSDTDESERVQQCRCW